jgi:hypothetical protein
MELDFSTIIRDTEEAFSKIGLYVQIDTVHIQAVPTEGSPPLTGKEATDELLQNRLAHFYISFNLDIGEVALSERVLNPESYEDKQTFLQVAPTDLEMMREQARRELEELKGWDDE